jgi:hypothetical protein
MIEVILCGRALVIGYDPIYVDQRDKGVTWRMDLWRKASIYIFSVIHLEGGGCLLATGQWFSPGTPVSSTNKTDCHDIAEKLLKVILRDILYH